MTCDWSFIRLRPQHGDGLRQLRRVEQAPAAQNPDHVQQIATEWLWTYNNERPNMGIGGVIPAMKLKMAA